MDFLDADKRRKARQRQLASARVARRALGLVIRAGSDAYRRESHLPRLIAIEPAFLAEDSIDDHRLIVRKLARALRAERNRGRAGHWTYDLNRHIGLRQAYVAESQRLAIRLKSDAGTAPPE